MGTDVIKSYDSLQQELDRAKNTLVTLNDNIRRIIGRDPKETNLRGDRKRHLNDSRRKDSTNERSKNRDGGGGGGGGGGSSPPPAKRRIQDSKSVFSRLSGPSPIAPSLRDDDAPVKPRIFSRVIRELPSREEIVTAQGPDAESRARNRRMFGSLLGTLHKFCQEESRLKKKEEQKAMVEKKVEEQEIKERANLKKERESLFMDRKRKQLEIRKIELKMYRLKDFKAWEKSKKDLVHFIRTKSKPPIYFRPKVLTKKTEKLLAENRAAIEKEIEKKRAAFDEEMLEIDNRFKLREDDQHHHDYEPHNNGGPRNSAKHDRQKSNHIGDEDDDDEDEDEEDDEDDDDIEETQQQKVQEIDSDHEEREVSRVISSSNHHHHEDLASIQIKIQNDIKKEDIDPTELETDNSNERTLPSSIIIPNKEIKRSIE
ncbi:pinin [Eupeodes corollae]|uniref:pinin n=1 Tax=Eupeodes corollae TaxID=290404 RepID=UPI00249182A7|nr:pinin [Eupeodes corollae]